MPVRLGYWFEDYRVLRNAVNADNNYYQIIIGYYSAHSNIGYWYNYKQEIIVVTDLLLIYSIYPSNVHIGISLLLKNKDRYKILIRNKIKIL